ncbi:hypothetical protein [Aestuariivirga sp.]|uniref:hypothetical protein n=1 Tax=Aestuariivirga sp. TaxID=2650926 RepID=UPI003BABEB13
MNAISGPFRPLRWLAHLPLAVLPLLAAVVLEGKHLQQNLLANAESRLAAQGQGWA